NRNRLALRARFVDHRHRLIQRLGALIEVARLQALIDAIALAFDSEAACARHHRRERLRATHASETRGQYPLALPVAAEMLAAHLGEGFVRSLHDSLRADINPRA